MPVGADDLLRTSRVVLRAVADGTSGPIAPRWPTGFGVAG